MGVRGLLFFEGVRALGEGVAVVVVVEEGAICRVVRMSTLMWVLSVAAAAEVVVVTPIVMVVSVTLFHRRYPEISVEGVAVAAVVLRSRVSARALARRLRSRGSFAGFQFRLPYRRRCQLPESARRWTDAKH